MAGHRTILPPGDVLIREREQLGRGALEKLGQRYGTSRQAVHKRISTYEKKQQQEQSNT